MKGDFFIVSLEFLENLLRFRLLVQSSPNGIVLLVDEMVRYANPVAHSLFEDIDMEGMKFEALFPKVLSDRIENSAKETRLGRVVPEWEVELPSEKRIMLKWKLTIFDGQPAVQVNLSDVTDRYSLMQERIRAEVAEEANQQLTQEIEQRIAVESTLKGTTARLRSIVESGEDFIIWTAGEDHQVTSANANFDQWLSLRGDSAENGNRSSTLKSQVLSSVDLNGFDIKDRFSRALAGKPQRFEWAISRDELDGGRRWLQLFLNPIDSVGGKGEISAIAYDITERKRIDRRIRDALKEKEILLQEVHHRVKNNLQIIHSILNLQKKFVDDERHKRLKAKKTTTKGASDLIGDQTEQLRPMSEVENKRLSVGHTFRSKEVLALRIAEEANLRGISTRVQRSDLMNLTVVGIDFYVHATMHEHVGWRVHSAICRECEDDPFKIPPRYTLDPAVVASKKNYLRIPIKAKMIVPTIKDAVADNPGITYQCIREIMKPYAKEYTLTDSIVQDGKNLAKQELFGDPDDNVIYARVVASNLRALGHSVVLIFHDRRKTLQMMTTVIILEEQMRRRKLNLPALDKKLQLNLQEAGRNSMKNG